MVLEPAAANKIAEILHQWWSTRLPGAVCSWLEESGEAAARGDKTTLFLRFGMVPRRTGKDDLRLSDQELSEACATRPGWQPQGWSIDQVARVWLVLQYPHEPADALISTLEQLFSAGEVHELVALYQALPLLPHPPRWRARCAEGIRSNMKAVFCAVAHHNPYPAEQLSEGAWNQLVLKCLFLDLPLEPIIGLEQRANPELARMLIDFARERWAAGRPVSPELWRCVGPHAEGERWDVLHHLLTQGNPWEQKAAALALRDSPDPRAADVLPSIPAEWRSLDWKQLAAAYHAGKNR